MAQADDQKIQIGADEQKQIFDELKKKPYSSQGVFFFKHILGKI